MIYIYPNGQNVSAFREGFRIENSLTRCHLRRLQRHRGWLLITIYIMTHLQILYNYHFGPTVARKICATGGPVTSTCGFSLDGKKCRIATVSLSSGSVEVKNCVIDVV